MLKKLLRSVAIAALFLIPIFPLIPLPNPFPLLSFSNSLFFPFITGKAFYFRILVELAFASWVVLAFLDAKYRPRFTSLTIGISLFVLVALIADLLGVNPIRSLWSNFERMEGWITVIHLWAFYIAATFTFGTGDEGRKIWHRWINTWLAVGFCVAMYGCTQLFGWFDIHQGGRVDASLGNAAYMAVYMLWNAGLATYMFYTALRRRIANAGFLQFAYPILAALFSFLVFETATRGTIFGLGLAIVTAMVTYALFMSGVTLRKLLVLASFVILEIVALIVSIKVSLSASLMAGSLQLTVLFMGGLALLYFIALVIYVLRTNAAVTDRGAVRARNVCTGIIAAIFVLGGIFMAVRNAPFVQHNEVLARIASISWSDTSNQARQLIWPMAMNGAMHRPIFGWGQENFNYIFNSDYNPKMWSQEQWFDRAHNVFLDWLVASGIVGLLAYLSLYLIFLVILWKSTLSTAEKSILTGLLAGYFVHNLFVFDNLASYAVFFAALAFINQFSVREAFSRSKFMAVWRSRAFSFDAVEYIVAPIVLVVFVGAIYLYNVRPIQANTRLITALESCSGPTADATLFQKALDVNTYVANQEIREQVLSCASNVISSQQTANPTKQAYYALSATAIQSQIAATPKDARIYVLAGSFMNQIGQTQEALPLLKQAHLLSPAKQSVDFELATAEINSGDTTDALATLMQAYESAPEYGQAKMAYATALVINGQEATAHQLFGTDPTIFDTAQMAGVYANLKQYTKAIAIDQELVKASPTDVNALAQLAQVQYLAGMKSDSVQTLKTLEAAHPELKDQTDAAIRQVQSGK